MKSFKATFAALVLVSTSGMAAEVQSLRCFYDLRPVDGNLFEVILTQQENGRYSASQHIVTAGFGSPVQDITKVIAKNLKCTFAQEDLRLVACHKSSSEEGESQNSGLNIQLVTTQGVGHHGKIETSRHLDISAYSPAFPKSLQKEIPLREGGGIPAGCEIH